MKASVLAMTMAALLAACGGHEGPRFDGAPPATAAVATPGGVVHFDLDCTICHSPSVTPGKEVPGQTLPTCNVAACHEHDVTGPLPAAVHQSLPQPGSACLDCHRAHMNGNNILLVREQILTPAGERAVELTNLNGLADGGFASVTPPVRGPCQVCHTATQFYRADGSGDSHFTFPCLACHTHAAGFAPPPTPSPSPVP